MNWLPRGAGWVSSAAAARCSTRVAALAAGVTGPLPVKIKVPDTSSATATAAAAALNIPSRGPARRRGRPGPRARWPGEPVAAASTTARAAARNSRSAVISSTGGLPLWLGRVRPAESLSYLLPRPGQPGGDRPRRDAKRQRRLGVAEPVGDQQQHVAIRPREPSQRRGELASQRLRRDPAGHLIGQRLGGGVYAGARYRPVEPDLIAPVPADEAGRDPIQPRPRVGLGGVVTVPPPEGHQEGLGEEVIGGVWPKTPRDVTVDSPRVPVEQPRETRRRGHRPADQLGIVTNTPASPRQPGGHGLGGGLW